MYYYYLWIHRYIWGHCNFYNRKIVFFFFGKNEKKKGEAKFILVIILITRAWYVYICVCFGGIEIVNTEYGGTQTVVSWSYLAGDEEGSENEKRLKEGSERREVRKGKILSNKFLEKWSVTGEDPTVITSLRWMGQCIGEGAHWDSLFTGLPLSHGWWVLKTGEKCFHFPSSSLIFFK